MTWDIIGLGAVASVGTDPARIFDALCAGRTGLSGLRAFDRDKYRAHQAYEIDDRAGPGPDQPLRATRWLTDAVAQALADAGLDADPAAYPVLVGTTLREQRSAELWWRHGTPLDPADLHFGTALRKRFGAARTFTFANACAATLCALGLATDLIELGQADTVVVAGTDSITESAFGSLDQVQNNTPEALRPFDKARSGMLMGEGAVAVVVRRRGHTGSGRRHAVLRGVSMNCDASHPTAPDRRTLGEVIRDAHRRAGLKPEEIDLVMLHGSGTQLNDQTEAAALADVFVGTGADPLLTAVKSMTGHTLGGSGLLSLVMAVLSLQRGIVPPILGLKDPIDEAEGLRLVRDRAVRAELSTAQVDAFGLPTAVDQVCGADGTAAAVWLGAPLDIPATSAAGATVLDLTARLGQCSGALGVLQCAAGAVHLSRGGPGPVLATAGGALADDGAAAMLLVGLGATS